MALIVEDGTGLSTAESFCSVSTANVYFQKRGVTDWDDLDSETKEQFLRKATDYMEQVYRGRWAGYRRTNTQALSWPRYDVPIKDSALNAYYDYQSVPATVANACAELAFKAIDGDLAPDVSRLTKKIEVDVIKVEYADGASPNVEYRAIDNMLEPYFGTTSSGFNIPLVRA